MSSGPGVYPDGTASRLTRLAAAAKISRQVASDDVEARDTEIEHADLQGMGIREISRLTGLSPGNVQRIIARRTAARQAG